MCRRLPLHANYQPPTADAGRQHRKGHKRLPLNTAASLKYCSPKVSTETNVVALGFGRWLGARPVPLVEMPHLSGTV